jgi:transcriptional regulator with XRE-family HTH domain
MTVGTYGRKGRADTVDCHVGARLRLLRKDRGLSQTALAARIGVTFQQLQKYESGRNRLSASTLYRLASALGVDVSAFFMGLPEPVRSDPA